MDIYSKYLKNYYDVCIDKHGDTPEMLRLCCLAIDFITNNRVQLTDKKTSEFFKQQSDENKVFKKYMDNILKIGSKLISDQPMTGEQFEQYDNIIKEFGYRCNICSVNNVKIIEALEERSKKMDKTSNAMEERIEIYIDLSLNEQELPKQPEFYQAILEYYARQLEGSALDINENAAISHLISAAQKGRLPEDITKIVLDELEERKDKNKNIDFNSVQDFDQYMKNVAEIRLQQGKMPRECSETIIRKVILQKQDISKYNGMVERALEDLAEYELEEAGIEGYPIMVLNQPLFKRKTYMGEHNADNKTIKLSRQYLKSYGIIEMLDTILHESTHAIQNKKIATGQLNRDTYKMLKEEILRDENDDFYYNNYKYMYKEIDARKSGYVKRNKLLKRIGISESQIVELDAGNIEQKIEEYCKEYEKGKMKKVDREPKDVDTIFLELLQKKPELLSKYPELKVEFEIAGDSVQRKSLADILVGYEQMLEQAKNQSEIGRISSLFSEILLSGGPISEEKMQEELEQLMALESENKIINSFKNKLLITKFPRQKVMEATGKRFYEKRSVEERHKVQQVLKQVTRSKQDLIRPEVENEGREE